MNPAVCMRHCPTLSTLELSARQESWVQGHSPGLTAPCPLCVDLLGQRHYRVPGVNVDVESEVLMAPQLLPV